MSKPLNLLPLSDTSFYQDVTRMQSELDTVLTKLEKSEGCSGSIFSIFLKCHNDSLAQRMVDIRKHVNSCSVIPGKDRTVTQKEKDKILAKYREQMDTFTAWNLQAYSDRKGPFFRISSWEPKTQTEFRNALKSFEEGFKRLRTV
ncbi:MAG TPA: hypothetical protein VLG76_00990 [Rhabdochlamydiaceae bacterium]|nr:hypothetical protein [Rhabdochlamydiaceae bacterium]